MSYTLRPYQRDMAEQVWHATETLNLPTLVVLATGGGKTVLTATLSDLWHTKGHRTWIFAHRRELIAQWSMALMRLGVSHGLIVPGRPMTRDRLQVCSIDTVLARLGELKNILADVDRIIVDEAHHVVAAGYTKVHEFASRALAVGVTATPFRLDGTGLGTTYRHVVAGPTMADLIGAGSLSPYVVIEPSLKLDMSAVKKRGADYVAADVAKVFDTDPITQAALLAYREHMNGKPTVVFCATVEHAENFAAAALSQGIQAASLDGGMNGRDRDAAIAGLGNGRLQMLTTCQVVDEGTDIPVVAGAMLLGSTLSTSRFLQRCGRVLRPAPGKERAVILDFGKNVETHGMPHADRKWTLAGGIKGLERAVTATRRCRWCKARCEAGPLNCPECNRSYGVASKLVRSAPVPSPAPAATDVFPQFSDAEILSMDLVALKKLARTKAELDRIATVRGYRKGWSEQILLVRRQAARSYRRY